VPVTACKFRTPGHRWLPAPRRKSRSAAFRVTDLVWYPSPYSIHIASRFALSISTLMLSFCNHLCRNMGVGAHPMTRQHRMLPDDLGCGLGHAPRARLYHQRLEKCTALEHFSPYLITLTHSRSPTATRTCRSFTNAMEVSANRSCPSSASRQ
jgi:hypothetical protein